MEDIRRIAIDCSLLEYCIGVYWSIYCSKHRTAERRTKELYNTQGRRGTRLQGTSASSADKLNLSNIWNIVTTYIGIFETSAEIGKVLATEMMQLWDFYRSTKLGQTNIN